MILLIKTKIINKIEAKLEKQNSIETVDINAHNQQHTVTLTESTILERDTKYDNSKLTDKNKNNQSVTIKNKKNSNR